MLASARAPALSQPQAPSRRGPSGCTQRVQQGAGLSAKARHGLGWGLLTAPSAIWRRARRVLVRKAAKNSESASSPEDVLKAWRKVYRKKTFEEYPPLDQVAHAMARTGDAFHARSVVDRARLWRVELDTEVYRDLLEGCRRSAEDQAAVALLKSMQEDELVPDVAMYETAVSAVNRGRRIVMQSVASTRKLTKKDESRVTEQELTELLEEMLENACEDISELRRALVLLAESGRVDRAEAFFQQVRRDFPEATDAMAAPYAAAGLFKEAARYGTTSLLGLRAAMEGWLRGGKPEVALELLSTGRSQKLQTDPVAYETAVKCCKVVGQSEWIYRLCADSYQALGQLMGSEMPAEQQYEAFRACVRSWGYAGNWPFALQLLTTLDPTRWGTRTQGALVQACFESGATEEAERLFDSMLDRGDEPDALTYHAMMLHYTKAGNEEKAEVLYRTCVRVGLCPAWEIRKNCMSVVGLDQELAGLALRIFLEKWRARTLKTRRITHDFVLVTTPQADGGEAWVPSDSEEKQMQDHLKSILTKEYGLTPARNLWGFVVPKLLLARYAGIGGEVKKAKLTRAEKANELTYRPPSEEFE